MQLNFTKKIESWPRKFAYATFENFCFWPFNLLFVPGLPGVLLFQLLTKPPAGPRAPGNLVVFLSGITLICLYAAALRAIVWWQAVKRWNEKIVVTPETLTWTKGGASQTLRWQDVTNYYLDSTGSFEENDKMVVEGGGQKLTWTMQLTGAKELRALTQRFAANAAVPYWASPTRHGGATPGERIFNYRTRGTTLSLILLTFFILFVTFCALRNRPAGSMKTGDFVFCGVLFAVTGWAWWRFKAARVKIDADGVLHNTAFGGRFLPWREVTGQSMLNLGQMEFLRVHGKDQTLWIFTGIDGLDELKGQIDLKAKSRDAFSNPDN